MNKFNFGSWKTTTGGVIALFVLVMVGIKVWNSYLTGQPVNVEDLVTAGLSLATAINGLAARDNDKSSQDVGIK